MCMNVSRSLFFPLYMRPLTYTPHIHTSMCQITCAYARAHTHTHTHIYDQASPGVVRAGRGVDQSERGLLPGALSIYIYIYIYILGRRAAPGAPELRGALEGCRGATRGAPTGTPTPTEGAGNLTPTEGAGNPRRYRGATEDYEEPQSAARSHSGSALIESR